MINKHINNLKNILIPCLVLSCLTGIFTGGLIFAFKVAASKVISLSASLYSAVREAPILLAPAMNTGMWTARRMCCPSRR